MERDQRLERGVLESDRGDCYTILEQILCCDLHP
jgi:hypothetical protein